MLTFPVAWDVPLRNTIPNGVEDIFVNLRNSCNQSFTYLVSGPDAIYVGEGDLHDPNFDEYGTSFDLWESKNPDFLRDPYHCRFSVTVYPTAGFFKESLLSHTPKRFAAFVAATFLVMIATFAVYDIMAQRRKRKLIQTAARTNAIVTSLFPRNVRDRIIAPQENVGETATPSRSPGLKGPPIADLYLETTILFADVVGFTAPFGSLLKSSHSSKRCMEPSMK